MTIEEFNQTSFCAGDEFKYHGEWHNVASLNFDEALVAYDMADDDDEDIELSWIRCESIEEFKPYQDIMKARHVPGMLTYDDGRTYEEQCREVMINRDSRCKEVVVDAEAMKRYLDNTSKLRDLVDKGYIKWLKNKINGRLWQNLKLRCIALTPTK